MFSFLTVAYFHFFSCDGNITVKLCKKPANCSYFICKTSNDKYFKLLSTSIFFLQVAHQLFDRFSLFIK